jgi:hypothetical protein
MGTPPPGTAAAAAAAGYGGGYGGYSGYGGGSPAYGVAADAGAG